MIPSKQSQQCPRKRVAPDESNGNLGVPSDGDLLIYVWSHYSEPTVDAEDKNMSDGGDWEERIGHLHEHARPQTVTKTTAVEVHIYFK